MREALIKRSEKKRYTPCGVHQILEIMQGNSPSPLTNSNQMQKPDGEGEGENSKQAQFSLAPSRIAFSCFGLSRVRCADCVGGEPKVEPGSGSKENNRVTLLFSLGDKADRTFAKRR